MSLINDLLLDLEARRDAAPAVNGLAGLTAVPRVAQHRRSLRAAGFATLLMAGSAWAVWYNGATVQSPAVPAASADAMPAAAAITTSAVASVGRARLLGLSSTLSQLPARRVAAARNKAASPAMGAAASQPEPSRQKPPASASPAPAVKPVVAVAEVQVDHLAAGLYALSRDDGAEAEKHFRELVSRDASDTDAWLNLAAALRQQGQAAQAQATLSAALGTAARPALLAQALARDLLGRSANSEALAVLRGYRPDSPLDPIHDAYIAAVLQRVGQHEEAARMYRTVLAIRPEAADWWVGLAISEEALGRGRDAIKAYRHARNIGHLEDALARYAEQRIAAIEGRQAS